METYSHYFFLEFLDKTLVYIKGILVTVKVLKIKFRILYSLKAKKSNILNEKIAPF